MVNNITYKGSFLADNIIEDVCASMKEPTKPCLENYLEYDDNDDKDFED